MSPTRQHMPEPSIINSARTGPLLAWAWLSLTTAFAVHVAAGAADGFREAYNPAAIALRDRVPILPLPTFTPAEWQTGQFFAIGLLLALTPFAFRTGRWFLSLAQLYAAVMFLNGVELVLESLYFGVQGRALWSAPILLAASTALFVVGERGRVSTAYA